MSDLLLIVPLIVGAIFSVGMFIAVVIGRIKFLKDEVDIRINPQTRQLEIHVGPFFGIMLTGSVLLVLPIIIDYFQEERAYTVEGTVVLQDSGNLEDVSIFPCYPPGKADSNGNFGKVNIWKDPADGTFPWLAVNSTGYPVTTVNLNDEEKVRINDRVILIIDNIEMNPYVE